MLASDAVTHQALTRLQPVTITLKRGSANNLQTVSLITGNASGNSYTWTPSSDIENGSDYALQITQDDTDINYTGLFTISGGKASSGSTLSASSTASSYASSSANSTTTVTAIPSGTAPASAGVTGASASRNTTLSRATLTASSSASSSGSSEATATTSGSPSGTTSPSPSASNAAVNIASNFGLLLAGFAAVAYLG